MQKGKVLVTGGAGFIGSHVCEELLKQGYEAAVFDDFSSGKEENLREMKGKLAIVRGDVREKVQLEAAMEGCKYVIHLAAMVSVAQSMQNPKKCLEINVGGTRNVLGLAKKLGVSKVALASSAAVYGKALPPLDESMPCEPLSPYGESKLANEIDAKEYSSELMLPATSLRYFNVYGPRQDASSPYSGVITKFLKLIKEGKTPTIFGDGRQTRDFIYVKDVARATVLALSSQKSDGEAINIGTGEEATLLELLQTLKKILKSSVKPKLEKERDGDIKYSYADITKAEKLLGFRAKYSLEEGLKETIAQM